MDEQLTTREEILKLENSLFAAMLNNDTAYLDYLLHDSLLFVNPHGQVLTKILDMETYRSGTLRIATADADQQEINLIGDAAVTSARIKLSGAFEGEAFEGTFRYIRVWKLFDADWKIIAGSSVRIE